MGSNISSIKRLQNYYLVLSLAFFLVSYQILSQQKLVVFSKKAELLVELLDWKNMHKDELSRDQLFSGTKKGIKISESLGEQYQLPSASQYEALGFTNDPISGGSIAVLELRSHPRVQCDLLMIERTIEGYYGAFAPTMSGKRFVLFSTSKVTFFDASDCVDGYQGQLSGLIIHSQEQDEDFFVLPISWLKFLPDLLWPEELLEIPFFEDESGQIESARGVESTLFPPMDHPVMTSSSALKNALAKAFSVRIGRNYKGSELQIAVDDLNAKKVENTTFAGINAPLNLTIHLAPLFLLFVLWQLHRAVQQIHDLKDDDYWVIVDVRDLSGLLVASTYALLPYFFSVLMAVCFCSALSINGVYFGYLLGFDEEMRLIIEHAPPRGWIHGVSMFSAFIAVLWRLHMCLAMKVSLNLLGITLKARSAGVV